MKTRDRGAAGILLAVGVLVAADLLFLLRYASFSVGGSDSSGYLNTARRMVAGTLVARPRTLDRLGLPDSEAALFIPLGFVQGPRSGTMAPFYPAGFPAHMAAAASIAGWERGPFLVSPIAGALCVVLFFLLARELSLPPAWAAASTAAFAAWPVLIYQAIQPMSDALTAFWALAAVLCAVKARRRAAWALASGAAFGIGVLVRPTSALLLVPLAFALPLSARSIALFVAGGIPSAAALGAYNLHCYASITRSGYGGPGALEAMAIKNFPVRFRYYGAWLLRTLTPLVPLAWLGLPFDRRPSWRDRWLLLGWFASFFVFYCFYEPYDSFGFLRFLLPGAPGLILGAFLAVRDLMDRMRRPGTVTAAVALFVVVLMAEASVVKSLWMLSLAEGEAIYPRACAWAAKTLPPRAVLLSMSASGALEYYTGLSYARYDWFEPGRFPELRAAVARQGGRLFALLFPFEVEQLVGRLPGPWEKIGTLRDVTLWEWKD